MRNRQGENGPDMAEYDIMKSFRLAIGSGNNNSHFKLMCAKMMHNDLDMFMSGLTRDQYEYICSVFVNSCDHSPMMCSECSEKSLISVMKMYCYAMDYCLRFRFICEHSEYVLSPIDDPVFCETLKYGKYKISSYLYDRGCRLKSTSDIYKYVNYWEHYPYPRPAGWIFTLDVIKFFVEKFNYDVNYNNAYILDRVLSSSGSYENDFPIIDYLVDHGIDIHINGNVLFRAVCTNNKIEALKHLMLIDASINARAGIVGCSQAEIFTSNHIMNALMFNSMDVVQFLIDLGIKLPALTENKIKFKRAIFGGRTKFITIYRDNLNEHDVGEFIDFMIEFLPSVRNFHVIHDIFSRLFDADIMENDNILFDKLITGNQIACIKYLLDNIYPKTEEELSSLETDELHWGKKQLGISTNIPRNIRMVITHSYIARRARSLGCGAVYSFFKTNCPVRVVRETCAICIADEMIDPIQLGCKHMFCTECVINLSRSSLSSRNKCPLCRTVFKLVLK